MRATLFITLVLCSLSSIRGENYLTIALDSAMAMKANFDYNAEYYRAYLNYEAESLSRNLAERVAQGLESATTEAQGAEIQSCSLMASYFATGPVGTVIDRLDVLQDEALVFYRIINEELMQWNVFETPFDVFYYQFSLRLDASYHRLNDILMQNVLDGLVDFVDASRVIFDNLDNCIAAV